MSHSGYREGCGVTKWVERGVVPHSASGCGVTQWIERGVVSHSG